MMEAGAAEYCVKGAPLWELERAIAGRSDPLVRLAHGLAKATDRAGIGTIVARELVELTGAAAAATYLASPDVALSLAGPAGARAHDGLAAAPGLALRAFSTLGSITANGADLRELAQLGLPCADALAVPLVSDGDVARLPAADDAARRRADVPDEDFVADIAALAASAFASERRLALTHAEARRDALTGLPNSRALRGAARGGAPRGGSGRAASQRRPVRSRRLQALQRLRRPRGRRCRAHAGRPRGRSCPSRGRRAVPRRRRRVCSRRRRRSRGRRTRSSSGSRAPSQRRPAAARCRRSPPASRRTPTTRGRSRARHRRRQRALRVEAARQVTCFPQPASWRHAGRRAGVGRPFPRPAPAAPACSSSTTIPGLLTLLRTTFELIDIEIDEATTAAAALAAIAARAPDVVVLDIGLPDMDGLTLCRRLKDDPATSWIGVVLLTGAGGGARQPARSAGADAFLRKPFSPLELLSVVERLAGGLYEGPFAGGRGVRVRRAAAALRERPAAAARDRAWPPGAAAAHLPPDRDGARRGARVEGLRHGPHSQRVQRYAVELAQAVEPHLLLDPSVEYGFLLHDVGKIGIPDHILQKRGPAGRLRAAPDAHAHAARRAAAARRRPPARRRAQGRPRPSRALGRPRLPRRARRAARSRSRRGSSPSPTPSTR